MPKPAFHDVKWVRVCYFPVIGVPHFGTSDNYQIIPKPKLVPTIMEQIQGYKSLFKFRGECVLPIGLHGKLLFTSGQQNFEINKRRENFARNYAANSFHCRKFFYLLARTLFREKRIENSVPINSLLFSHKFPQFFQRWVCLSPCPALKLCPFCHCLQLITQE